jgi:hypothetical protein
LAFICDICEKEIQFTNKRVDAFCNCKHKFHSMCLRTHINNFYTLNTHQHFVKCPKQGCNQRKLVFVTIYCQVCLTSHRDFDIKEHGDITQIYSYICFRCKAIKKDLKKQAQQNCCCGLGRYLCCHYC